jgi:Flp pilus assembly protein TadG
MSTRRFWRHEEGATAVEFAIVAVPFLMIVLGTFEFGRAFNARNDMAREMDIAERAILIAETPQPGQQCYADPPLPYVDTSCGRSVIRSRLTGTYSSAVIGTPVNITDANGIVIERNSTVTLTKPVTLLIPYFNRNITMTVARTIRIGS